MLTWWRWITLPWRSAGMATALLGAFAMPALMVATAPLFEESAADAVTTRLVSEVDPLGLGVTVSIPGLLVGDATTDLSEVLEARLDRIGDPIRTLVTDRLDLDPVPPTSAVADPTRGRRGARLFSRPGAIEGLTVVAGEHDAEGAWISERLADLYGLGPGDAFLIGGPDPLTVAGVYRDLWSEAPLAWRDVPGELIPRFLTVYNAPNFELVIVPDHVMFEIAPPGTARWEVPLDDRPSTFADLRARVVEYQDLERASSRDPALAPAIDVFAGSTRRPPRVDTRLYDIDQRARQVVAALGPPISVTRLGGVVLGLVVTGAGATFAVRRRASEFRLLAADGDAGWRFAARAVPQYASFAILGSAAGVAAGWAIIAAFGPSGSARLGAVHATEVVAVATTGLAIAATVTGVLGHRVLSSSTASLGAVKSSWLWLVAGLAVAGWIQVGSAPAGRFDPTVVAFPIIGLSAGVGLTLTLLRWVLRRGRSTGGSLPVPLFLAWRRLTSAEAGAMLLAGAIGVSFGLSVFSAVFVDTLETTSRAKVATQVGAATRIEVLGRFDPLDMPPESTLIRTQSTRATPGGSVLVVAIDPATFAATVDWPAEFGSSADAVVARLGIRVDDAVPALLVEGRSLPASGGVGLGEVVPYRVVGTVGSVPLASSFHPTLVVRTDLYETVARKRWEATVAADADLSAEVAAGGLTFETPMSGFARTIVSRSDATTVRELTDAALMRTRDLVTAGQRAAEVENQAIGWAFQYLRLLGALAALSAFGALVLYSAERRSTRAVATVMAEQMGMRPSTTRWAAVHELVGLVVVSIAAACLVALAVASRLFPRFEPDPTLPPSVGLQQAPVLIGSIIVVNLVVVTVLALATNRPSRSVTKAAVLRGRN